MPEALTPDRLRTAIDLIVDRWHPVGCAPSRAETEELKVRLAREIWSQMEPAQTTELDRLKEGLAQIWTENFVWAQNIGFRGFAERIGGQLLNLQQGKPVNDKDGG